MRQDSVAMAQAGDTVRVHYMIKLEGGAVLDDSRDHEPLEFTVGAGRTIPGLEEAVLGMAPGQSKVVTIPSEKAFGPHRQELVFQVERDRMPASLSLKLGQKVDVRGPEGYSLTAEVTDITDSHITLDANYRLVGMNLILWIKSLEILARQHDASRWLLPPER